MKTPFLAVTLLALSTTFAQAEVNSLSGKAMADLPGTKGGSTANPTARVETGDLSDHAFRILPGAKTGRTANPLAQPDDFSLSAKAMKDLGARS